MPHILVSVWVFAPVAWLVGVPWAEAGVAGELLGTKLVLNEFLAYLQLASLPEGTLSLRVPLVTSWCLGEMRYERVVERGSVAEHGTHETLVTQNGIYAELSQRSLIASPS